MDTVEEKLNMTFQEVGNRFGFDNVTATYAAFTDVKVKWIRTMRSIEMHVTDYLAEAPENVLRGIAECIFGKIKGNDTDYSDDVVEWLTSDEILAENQDTYIARNKMIDTDEGRYKNLEESLDRLKEKKLLNTDTSKVKIFWSADKDWIQAGSSSNLMKTVIINKRFDSDDVDNDVLDLVVLKYVCYATSNFKDSKDERAEKLESKVGQYPGFDSVIDCINKMGLDF